MSKYSPPHDEEKYRAQILDWLGRIELDFVPPNEEGKTKVSIPEFGITVEAETMELAYAMAMAALEAYVRHLTTDLAIGKSLPPRPEAHFRPVGPLANG